jgi:hypothetical protein
MTLICNEIEEELGFTPAVTFDLGVLIRTLLPLKQLTRHETILKESQVLYRCVTETVDTRDTIYPHMSVPTGTGLY